MTPCYENQHCVREPGEKERRPVAHTPPCFKPKPGGGMSDSRRQPKNCDDRNSVDPLLGKTALAVEICCLLQSPVLLVLK